MKKLLYILLFICFSLNAQQLAFPTALGDGAYVTGGRSGVVVHVTNLNNDGAGSFREAMQMQVTRTIVFDVSGVITLTSVLGGVGDNVTIAGQTAPEGGITIDGDRVYINSVNQIICRYIRFKGGIDGDNDSLTVNGDVRNQIFDHCSFAFGDDEAASWYGATDTDICENVTIQRSLFAESPKASIIGVNADDLNLSTPAVQISASFINNLFYNSGYRFPNITGKDGRFDIIGNVIHRVSGRLIRGNGDYSLNHIGNHYNYTDYSIADERINLHRFGYVPSIYTDDNFYITPNTGSALSTTAEINADNTLGFRYFQDGDEVNAGSFEIGEDYTIPSTLLQGNTDYTLIGASSNTDGQLFTATGVGSGTGIAYNLYYGEQLPTNYFTVTQHTLLGEPFTLKTRAEYFTDVTNDVGCNKRLNSDGTLSDNLDTLDASWINNVKTETFAPRLDKNTEYIVPPISSITRVVSFDTDGDGIPDQVEDLHIELDKANGSDGALIHSSGYSNLEYYYLNLVDGSIVISIPGNNTEVSKKNKLIIISN